MFDALLFFSFSLSLLLESSNEGDEKNRQQVIIVMMMVMMKTLPQKSFCGLHPLLITSDTIFFRDGRKSARNTQSLSRRWVGRRVHPFRSCLFCRLSSFPSLLIIVVVVQHQEERWELVVGTFNFVSSWWLRSSEFSFEAEFLIIVVISSSTKVMYWVI